MLGATTKTTSAEEKSVSVYHSAQVVYFFINFENRFKSETVVSALYCSKIIIMVY